MKTGTYRISLGAFGESLARNENFVSIDPNLKDAWGIPALHISMTHGENEKALARRCGGDCRGDARSGRRKKYRYQIDAWQSRAWRFMSLARREWETIRRPLLPTRIASCTM